MRIGVDGSCWINNRGFGRFTRELLQALLNADPHHEYWLFLDAETARRSENLPSSSLARRIIVSTSAAASQAASSSGNRSLLDVWRMSRAVAKVARELDVFYFPTIYTFFPVGGSIKTVVTGHDTTAEQFPDLIFPTRRAKLFWNLKAQWAYRRADLVTTVSHSAKRDLIRRFGLQSNRVRVISDGVAPHFRPVSDTNETQDVLKPYGIAPGDCFVLYVGGISPHKNIETLVEAFAIFVRKRPADALKLVLVGDFEHDVFYSSYQTVRRLANRLAIGSRVVFTGFVPDLALTHFYNAARVSVLPSFAEGFGLPALESMACGVPVVASRVGALPEVIGDTGMLFDPNSPEELEQCLERLLDDEGLRVELGSRAAARARTFSWERSAAAMLDAFENARERPFASCGVASV